MHTHVHTHTCIHTHTCTRSAQPSAEDGVCVRNAAVRYGPSGTQPWFLPVPGQTQVPLQWPQAVWSGPWSRAAGDWPDTGSSTKPLLSDCPLLVCSMKPGAGGQGGHSGGHTLAPGTRWAGSTTAFGAPQEGGKPPQLTSSDPDGGMEGPDGFLAGIAVIIIIFLTGAQHLQGRTRRGWVRSCTR